MKLFLTILFFKMTVFGQSSKNDLKMLDTNKTENCFSSTNFDIIYLYINNHIKKKNNAFYKYGNYELYIIDATKISLKKNGYTLSSIVKERGVFSLAKRKEDHDPILKKTHQIFCELLISSEK